MDISKLLFEQLHQQLDGGLMNVLSQQTGADTQTTARASSAILSSMLGAMARNASTPDGAKALANALDRDHDGSILDILGGLMQGARRAPGPDVPTGGGLIDLINGMTQGNQRSSGGGGLGGLLGGILGGGRQQQRPQQAPTGGGALGDLLGGLLSQGSQRGGLGDLLGGLMRQTRGNDGGGLGDLLGGLLGGTQTGTQEYIPPQFRKSLNGGGILDNVLGEQKTEVAREVSSISGLSMSKVLPLMATLAPIIMGMLGRTKRKAGLDAGGLGGALIDMVTRSQQNPRQNAPDLGMAGTFLDTDGDGQIIDDIASIGAKMLGGYFSK